SQPCQKLDDLDRFDNVIVGAGLERSLEVVAPGQGRNHDYGNIPKPRIIPETTAKIDAVLIGQQDIEENDINRRGQCLQSPPRLAGSARRNGSFVARTLEHLLQESAAIRGIVNDEN